MANETLGLTAEQQERVMELCREVGKHRVRLYASQIRSGFDAAEQQERQRALVNAVWDFQRYLR